MLNHSLIHLKAHSLYIHDEVTTAEYKKKFHLPQSYVDFLRLHNGVDFGCVDNTCVAYPAFAKDRTVERLAFQYEPEWPPGDKVYGWEIGILRWLAGIEPGGQYDIATVQKFWGFGDSCKSRFLIIGGGDTDSRVCMSLETDKEGAIFEWEPPYDTSDEQTAFGSEQFVYIAEDIFNFCELLQRIRLSTIIWES